MSAKSILSDSEVTSYLKDLHSNFVLVPIDKASNNIAIICKRFYIERLLSEVGLSENHSNISLWFFNVRNLRIARIDDLHLSSIF